MHHHRFASDAGGAMTARAGRRIQGEDGFALALTVLLLLPILAMASVAVDLGAWYARADQLQRAADAAALAGAPLLPDTTAASATARTVLEKNGITCGGTVTCTMGITAGKTPRYRVTVRDDNVVQFFSRALRDQVSIERTATAERIRPVPMGSPRNFLGTNRLSLNGRTSDENFWLTTAGYCSKHEHGDRIAPYADNNGGSGDSPRHSCRPGAEGGPSHVRANPEYSAQGYFFGITVPGPGSWNVDVYDAANCAGTSSGSATNETGNGQASLDFIMRSHDSESNPAGASLLEPPKRVTPADCATYRAQWRTMFTVNAVGTGFPRTYFLQVRPVVPTDTSSDEGGNDYAIRAHGGSFTPCTNDPTSASMLAPYVATCPNVFAYTHLPIYATIAGSTPSFYLSSVGSEHAGKTMEVELFDAAEKSRFVELLDPTGNPAEFTAEISCSNGRYPSETGGSCPSGDTPPAMVNGSRYGPWTTTKLDICGNTTIECGAVGESTGDQARSMPQVFGYSHLTQRTLYSNRTIRLTTKLPTDYATRYGANTWWRVRYTAPPSSFSDRTTWSVRIKGDPVRLVPNN